MPLRPPAWHCWIGTRPLIRERAFGRRAEPRQAGKAVAIQGGSATVDRNHSIGKPDANKG